MSAKRCPVYCTNKCKVQHHPLLIALINTGSSKNRSQPSFTALEATILRYEKLGNWTVSEEIQDPVLEYRLPLIHWAACLGKVDVVKWLLERNRFSMFAKKPDTEYTALHSAIENLQVTCQKEASDIFSQLVRVLAGCLTHCTAEGNTPLHLCCMSLLNEEPKVEYFHNCIMNIIKFGVTRPGGFIASLINAQNHEGDTPVHIMARHDRNLGVLKSMIDLGKVDLNIKNSKKQNVLEVSIEAGCLKVSAYISHLMKMVSSTPQSKICQLKELSPSVSASTRTKTSLDSNSVTPKQSTEYSDKLPVTSFYRDDQTTDKSLFGRRNGSSPTDLEIVSSTEHVTNSPDSTKTLPSGPSIARTTQEHHSPSSAKKRKTSLLVIPKSVYSQTLFSECIKPNSNSDSKEKGSPSTQKVSSSDDTCASTIHTVGTFPSDHEHDEELVEQQEVSDIKIENDIAEDEMEVYPDSHLPRSTITISHVMSLSQSNRSGGEDSTQGKALMDYLSVCESDSKRTILNALTTDKNSYLLQKHNLTTKVKGLKKEIHEAEAEMEKKNSRLKDILSEVEQLQTSIFHLAKKSLNQKEQVETVEKNIAKVDQKLQYCEKAIKDFVAV